MMTMMIIMNDSIVLILYFHILTLVMADKAVFLLDMFIIPLARGLEVEGDMRLQTIFIVWLLVKPMCVSPGRSITPSPGRILVAEASNPNICILNEVLKETICASIWY